jgi:arylformamidase
MHQSQLKEGYTVLNPDAAEFLVSKKIKTIGIDYISIDEHNSPTFPVHKILLGAGVTILEGLVLDNVPEGEYVISALPLKFKNGDGSPIRAILVSEN